MCNECQGTFPHDLVEGEIQPIECDLCGKQAAYSPEECYWASGPGEPDLAKAEPTYVILKSRMDPTYTGQTNCPDCGRRVQKHNKAVNTDMNKAREKLGG